MTASLEISREQRVLRVTLNRPEKRNALTSEICGSIADTVEAAEHDESVGAIILDAKGDVFCAGMDLDEAILPDAADQTVVHQRLFTLGARVVPNRLFARCRVRLSAAVSAWFATHM